MGQFDKRQIKDFVKQAKKEWGEVAWYLIGTRFQRALIYERALAVVRGQARESIDIEVVDDLVVAMMTEAKLRE